MVCHVTQENYRIVCKARQLLRREKWGVSGGDGGRAAGSLQR